MKIKTLVHNGEKFDYEYKLYKKNIDDPYFYDISFSLASTPGKSHGIIITAHGVSIDWHGGASTHTNIVPKALFPGKLKLKKDDLRKIIDIVDTTRDGKTYSAEEMENLHEEWKNLGSP